MPGDVINAEVYAKYVDPVTSNWNAALTTLVNQVAAGTAGVVVDGVNYSNSTSTFPALYPTLVTKTDNGAPKAYLNWLVFDRNFVFLNGGFKQITTAGKEAGTDVAHERVFNTNPIVIAEPGYVYIYVSNENTTPVDVYFDDFKVTQTKSPVIQQDDYYPFGAIAQSYSREGSLENRFKYQSKEYQDDLGLNLYDFHWRQYDPWSVHTTTIDPKAEKFYQLSPYSWAAGNPMKYIDPDGREIIGTDGKPVTYQTVNGQTVWSKNASADVQRVGNALLQTKAGSGRLDALVSSDTKVSIKVSGEVKISKNEETGKTTVRYGETKITKFEKNADGSYSAKEATLTVFEGTIKTIAGQKQQLSGDAGEKQQIGVEGSIGAVAAHESVHAVDPENVNQNLQNQLDGKNNDIEKKPEQVEKQVQSELLKKKNEN
jgi:RHS repeat-associated protein